MGGAVVGVVVGSVVGVVVNVVGVLVLLLRMLGLLRACLLFLLGVWVFWLGLLLLSSFTE